MKTAKNNVWNFNNEIELEACNPKMSRKILAYSEDLMCVENHFEEGGVGALHHHPHTQITYVVSGKFEFTIGDEVKVVEAGDSLLSLSDIVHGCKCLEKGIILDLSPFSLVSWSGNGRYIPVSANVLKDDGTSVYHAAVIDIDKDTLIVFTAVSDAGSVPVHGAFGPCL